MSVFTLYRFYDAEDVLLYVGLTVNPGRRMEKHRATQPWWGDVARIEMEQHPDIDTLRAAEREAIKTERPLHNIRMNDRRIVAALLVWHCEICHEPIDDEHGYIYICYSDLNAYDTAEKEYEERVRLKKGNSTFVALDMATFFSAPELVRWHVRHAVCDDDEDSGDYGIAVERIRTPQALIGWTAHLLESKGWVQNTNWDAILRAHAGDDA